MYQEVLLMVKVYKLTGTLSVANSGAVVTGFGTLFNTELKIGDEIIIYNRRRFITNKNCRSLLTDNTSLTLSVVVGGVRCIYKNSCNKKQR